MWEAIASRHVFAMNPALSTALFGNNLQSHN